MDVSGCLTNEIQSLFRCEEQPLAGLVEDRDDDAIEQDGPLRASLGALVDRLGLANRLLFTGFCLDAPALIGCLDLLVIPSLSEGTPLVVLEAMFAGVPIVASAVGGIPEQVGDGREAVYALT